MEGKTTDNDKNYNICLYTIEITSVNSGVAYFVRTELHEYLMSETNIPGVSNSNPAQGHIDRKQCSAGVALQAVETLFMSHIRPGGRV